MALKILSLFFIIHSDLAPHSSNYGFPSSTVCVLNRSIMSDSVTPWTVAHQVPLSIGFPRQEYWSVLPFPTPGDLPNPGIKPRSSASPALAGRFFTTEIPRNSQENYRIFLQKISVSGSIESASSA